LSGCGGANEGVALSLGQAQTIGLNESLSPLSEQVRDVDESSSWVLDRFILFYKRMGFAIEGREIELLSFLASLESIRAEDNHLVDDRGRVSEEGEVH